MRRLVIACCALAALALPVTALAVSGKDKSNASRECRALRHSAGTTNFGQIFGGGRDAFGKCVSKYARREAQQTVTAQKNAAKECKKEQSDSTYFQAQSRQSAKTFEEFYGTNKNGKNAYGKCVSMHAKQNKQDADQEDQNESSAAKECKREKAQSDADFEADASHNKQTFAGFYGTNHNNRNAFGKCVSKHAHELNQQDANTNPTS